MRQLICPVLIGRAPQLEELGTHLEAARGGTGRLVVIPGEAGVGKTRFINAVTELATARGFRVVSGGCLEQFRSYPYAPVIDALSGVVSAGNGVGAEVFLETPDSPLIRLLPQLRRGESGSGSAPRIDPEDERLRIVEAIGGGFGRLADQRPLLLTLEDLHWADEATVNAIPVLARRFASHPVVTILTFRSDEIQGHPQLQHVLLELLRQRLAEEIPLDGLTLPQVGEMVQAIFALAEPVSAEFRQAVFDRTEGNPFFIEELLRTLVETGGLFLERGRWDRRAVADLSVPATVQEAILRRVAALPDEAQRILTAAAVLGQRFRVEPLRALSESTEAAVLESLRSLINQQLIVEDRASGEFRFRHALTRDTVYGQLLAPERRAMHRAVAAALEVLHGERAEDHAAELAFHYRLAEVKDKARFYATVAGQKAGSLGSLADARNHFADALGMAEGERDRATLLLALGRIDHFSGQIEAAIATFREAAATFGRAGDVNGQARALLELAESTLMHGDRAGALRIRVSVLDLLEPLGPSKALAWAYRALGHHHMLGAAHEEAIRWSEKALALAQELGAERVAAESMNDLGVALVAGGRDPERGLRLLRESLALSQRHEWAGEAGRAFVNLVVVLSDLGRYAEGIETGREGVRYCHRMGCDFHRRLVQANLSELYFLRGEWSDAEAQVNELMAAATALESRKYYLMGLENLAVLRAGQGRWGEIPEYLNRLEPLALERDELQHVHPLRLTRARLLATQGDAKAAWAELDTLRTYWRRFTDDVVLIASALAFACELGAASGDPDRAEEFFADLAAVAARSPSPTTAVYLTQAAGLLAFARKDWAAAIEALTRATDGWTELGRSFDQAQAQRWLGTAHLARGEQTDRAQAQRVLEAAREVFQTLGARRDLRLTEAALRRGGFPVKRGPRPVTRRAPGGLTPRELEVAGLVAQGKSNAEIAGALFIAPKTAAIHVSNILSKLGFSTRAEIARWAGERSQVGAGRT